MAEKFPVDEAIRRTRRKGNRIQLQRRSGWKKPEGAIVVSRPSRWGNPVSAADLLLHMRTVAGDQSIDFLDDRQFRVSDLIDEDVAKTMAVQIFEKILIANWDTVRLSIHDLWGRDLCCWCASSPCHADVLIDYALASRRVAAALPIGLRFGRGLSSPMELCMVIDQVAKLRRGTQ